MRDRLLIIGSGGHAKVVIDIFKRNSVYDIVGCISADETGQSVLGVPVLGDDTLLAELLTQGINFVFVAIGDNRLRNRIYEKTLGMGFQFANAISSFSCISPTVKLGNGIAIMPGVVINAESVIEDNVIINTGATIDHDNRIQASAHIAPGSNLAGNVTVGTGAFLGIGCKVIPGVTIGAWSTVGAGAVVLRSLPSDSSAVGVPARVAEQKNQRSE